MESEQRVLPEEIVSREENKAAKEIERKYLLKSLPEDLESFPSENIEQGYVSVADDIEVRLRHKDGKFFQTVKSGTGKVREEVQKEIPKELFDAFWGMTAGKRVEKTRYEVPNEAGTIYLDVYKDKLQGLVSAEVEFDNEDDCDNFVPPEWFGVEVSDDERYKNKNLAIYGIPKSLGVERESTVEDSDIPVFELDEGVNHLTELIRDKVRQTADPVVVEVAGGSASGKTSAVASRVKKSFGEDALIFSMDDYYRGVAFMEEQKAKGNELNWDQPEALNLELLQDHLSKLKKGESVEKPIYDMKKGEASGTETLNPKNVIIVEGLFALNDLVKDEGDVKAFVDIGTHGRVLRRLLRDIERTGQQPKDILKYFAEVVQPMHDKYIEATKANADLVVKNEYNPEVEAERSGLHEVQLKFAAEIDSGKIRKLGGERLGTSTQVDNYYNPLDRDLLETGEILRIREDGNDIILTYKGPKVESGVFRERPKFEFEIDEDTEKAFLGIYGDRKKTINKKRTLYQVDGVVFSVDNVSKTENGKTTKLGGFVEIRSTNKDVNEDNIRSVIEKLGLKADEGIKESYFEM